MRALWTAMLVLWMGILPAPGQEMSALARLDPKTSTLAQSAYGIQIVLSLSQSVPWRARLFADPPRLVMDFREVDFGNIAEVPVQTEQIKAVRAGIFRAGWSRLVLQLDGPFEIGLAEMTTGTAGATIAVDLVVTDEAKFAKLAALPEPMDWAQPKSSAVVPADQKQSNLITVVLDPGHGGLDPGAERDGQSEAALMLGFAKELKEMLLRTGSFNVVLTRDEDMFVPLETRISIARTVGADVFISLHADALAEGEAVGAAIYTLSQDASEKAAAALAERHNRDDLLAGVDLTGQDDLVATILMDMARTETTPRTARLAAALEDAIKSANLKMHRVPQQMAGFSVLKSPDIPSVLIELGFLSSARDLARLSDGKWRASMAEAIRNALLIWSQEDQALQSLRKKQ